MIGPGCIAAGVFPDPGPLRAAVEAGFLADETACVERLLTEADPGSEARVRIVERALALATAARGRRRAGTVDAFLHEYGLTTEEGVILMCLAESLLRVPDAATANRLIRDKIVGAHWEAHLGNSDSVLVNASTVALILTGRVIGPNEGPRRDLSGFLAGLVTRSGEPLVRTAMVQAMRILGRQFVMGRTIEEALERARGPEGRRYRHSFDMLGEAALNAADARRYFDRYADAIGAIGAAAADRGPIAGPGVSVKLSALHPRHELAQRERLLRELAPRLLDLARAARAAGIGLTIDAEEADRLEPSLDVIEAVFLDASLAGWEGFGLAVQAYQKRAPAVIDWVADLARRSGRRIMVRLVKGAYWDSEIKHAQERGLAGYPVFTRKASTDVSYLACARRLLAARDAVLPQFATHNAHTVAAVLELAGNAADLEFQRLHGMGEALYDALLDEGGVACRVYCPVGGHEDLLAYLVRRLLENGANTSFVNRLADGQRPIAEVVADPFDVVCHLAIKPHPRIPLPRHLFGGERLNSIGINLSDPAELRELVRQMNADPGNWRATPVIGGARVAEGAETPVRNPADRREVVGTVTWANATAVERALDVAAKAAPAWDAVPAAERAACLERAADRMEAAMPMLMAMAVREAGKTLPDAVAEVREAVDFCRYYAARARADFAGPEVLPGPTGERNELSLHGRGVFACVSPWNFPLAIFTGQVAAALAAGNVVIAKPAEQTPLIAARAVEILHAAGIPGDVLNLLPGDGRIGAALVNDPRVAGVAFTGSLDVARAINRALAARPGPIVPLIAETGGQNAMVADSTALPEQLVADVVTSAFRSAGQRCSALRVLFVQEDIQERVLDMLAGATAELVVGDPGRLATDIGPVIDEEALRTLTGHAARMERRGRPVCLAPVGPDCAEGTFFAPRAYRIDRLDMLEGEVFGPILHIIPFAGDRLDAVIAAINAAGYGLTLGIHSRVNGTTRQIHARMRVGNTYVNRPMIGSMVGVQPFGGEGLSGTGPKAGGPRYLHRFATERTLTVDLAATGGNPALLSLDPEE